MDDLFSPTATTTTAQPTTSISREVLTAKKTRLTGALNAVRLLKSTLATTTSPNNNSKHRRRSQLHRSSLYRIDEDDFAEGENEKKRRFSHSGDYDELVVDDSSEVGPLQDLIRTLSNGSPTPNPKTSYQHHNHIGNSSIDIVSAAGSPLLSPVTLEASIISNNQKKHERNSINDGDQEDGEGMSLASPTAAKYPSMLFSTVQLSRRTKFSLDENEEDELLNSNDDDGGMVVEEPAASPMLQDVTSPSMFTLLNQSAMFVSSPTFLSSPKHTTATSAEGVGGVRRRMTFEDETAKQEHQEETHKKTVEMRKKENVQDADDDNEDPWSPLSQQNDGVQHQINPVTVESQQHPNKEKKTATTANKAPQEEQLDKKGQTSTVEVPPTAAVQTPKELALPVAITSKSFHCVIPTAATATNPSTVVDGGEEETSKITKQPLSKLQAEEAQQRNEQALLHCTSLYQCYCFYQRGTLKQTLSDAFLTKKGLFILNTDDAFGREKLWLAFLASWRSLFLKKFVEERQRFVVSFSLDYKKRFYVEIIQELLRLIDIVWVEERQRVHLLFFHERSQLVIQERAVDLASIHRNLLRFHWAVTNHRKALCLMNNEMTEREEIEEESIGFRMWFWWNLADISKQALQEKIMREWSGVYEQIIVQELEGRCRFQALQFEMTFMRPALFSNFWLTLAKQQFQLGFQRWLEQVQWAWWQSGVGPRLVIHRTVQGYLHRCLMSYLHLSALPRRRRNAAVSLMHSVAKAFFVREQLRKQNQRILAKRQAILRKHFTAVRLIQRIARAGQSRLNLAAAMVMKKIFSKNMVQLRLEHIGDVEAIDRLDIEQDYINHLFLIRQQMRQERFDWASGVMHGVMAGFVARVDVGWWRRHGTQPLAHVKSNSRNWQKMSQALDWHSMATRHHLGVERLCDEL